MIDNDILRNNRITVVIENSFTIDTWYIIAHQFACDNTTPKTVFHDQYDTFEEMVKEFNKFLKEFDAK